MQHDVVLVFQLSENRDSKHFFDVVLLFSDGSHLCQCRRLQTPEMGRPPVATPRWTFLDRRGEGAEGTEGLAAPSGAAVGERWKAFVGSRHAVLTVWLDVKEKGPTLQDMQVPYVDLSKMPKLALGAFQ